MALIPGRGAGAARAVGVGALAEVEPDPVGDAAARRGGRQQVDGADRRRVGRTGGRVQLDRRRAARLRPAARRSRPPRRPGPARPVSTMVRIGVPAPTTAPSGTAASTPGSGAGGAVPAHGAPDGAGGSRSVSERRAAGGGAAELDDAGDGRAQGQRVDGRVGQVVRLLGLQPLGGGQRVRRPRPRLATPRCTERTAAPAASPTTASYCCSAAVTWASSAACAAPGR